MFRGVDPAAVVPERVIFIGSCTVVGDMDELANAESILDLLDIPRLGATPTRDTVAARVGEAQRHQWLDRLRDARASAVPSAVRHDLLGSDGQARAALTTFMPFISDGQPHGVHVVVVDLRIPHRTDGVLDPARVPRPRDSSDVEPAPGEAAEVVDVSQVAHLSTIVSRAVLSESASISVADLTQPDAPLVYVNAAFEQLTGYSSSELMGHNCRLLQGPLTDRTAVASVRAAIAAGAVVSTELINYRRDGSTFRNQLNLAPIRDPDGVVTHYVGYQVKVSD